MTDQGRPVAFESDGWVVDLVRRELRTRGMPVPLGVRSFEVLAVLVQAAGELVTKDELMERVWPGIVVEENTLQVHISALRKVLGPDRAMLKTCSGRGYRLLGTWVPRREESSAIPVAEPVQNPTRTSLTNLPHTASALIGRSDPLQHVLDLLSAYRLVTLTGPGGIGKTALALAVAHHQLASFPGDACLVELASLADSTLVPSAAAGALGLSLVGDEMSTESVARAIGGRRLLLILDNCEHVIGVAAQLAQTIVRMCPGTSILCTSREALGIAGERVYRVAPLDVPPPDQDDPDRVLGHSAVQLFITRLRALDSQFAAQPGDLAVIAAICRRLDGIPLAIEFAAARAAALRLPELLLGLDDRFGLLTGGLRTAPPRHKTLRATLDWSYELLPDSEQCLLRRLGIFVGGFTVQAATSVMGDTRAPQSVLLSQLADLVARSLVTVDRSATGTRWRLLETIRAYALEKLAASDEGAQVARSHAEFFRDLVLAADFTPAERDIARYGREIDNVRAALDWAFSPAGDPSLGVTLTAAFAPVWLILMLMVECSERTGHALNCIEGGVRLSAPLRMQLNLEHGVALEFTMGSVERIKMTLGTALDLAESLHDANRQLRALWGLWGLYNQNGECRVAQSIAQQFADVAARTGDTAAVCLAQRLIGLALHYEGDQQGARQRLERALTLYVDLGKQRATMWAQFDQKVLSLAVLGRVLFLQGFLDQAAELAQGSLRQAQSRHSRLSQCEVLRLGAGSIALLSDDLVAAERAVATYLETAAAIGAPNYVLLARCLQGRWLIRRGEFHQGLEVLRAVLDTCERVGWTVSYPELLGAIAEGSAGLGQISEALATVERALTRAQSAGEQWYVPELLRLKGEFLLRQETEQSVTVAEDCFHRMLAAGRQQGALFWELRGALSLAHLKLRQDRQGEALQVLAPVYDRFREGFETTHMRAARAIIDLPTR